MNSGWTVSTDTSSTPACASIASVMETALQSVDALLPDPGRYKDLISWPMIDQLSAVLCDDYAVL